MTTLSLSRDQAGTPLSFLNLSAGLLQQLQVENERQPCAGVHAGMQDAGGKMQGGSRQEHFLKKYSYYMAR